MEGFCVLYGITIWVKSEDIYWQQKTQTTFFRIKLDQACSISPGRLLHLGLLEIVIEKSGPAGRYVASYRLFHPENVEQADVAAFRAEFPQLYEKYNASTTKAEWRACEIVWDDRVKYSYLILK